MVSGAAVARYQEPLPDMSSSTASKGILSFPIDSARSGLDFSQLATHVPSSGPPITIAGRLTQDLSRYALNKRDKNIATISLFFVPDPVRDCVPFVAKSSSLRRVPGTLSVYCCGLEVGLEQLKLETDLLDAYRDIKERSVSGRHKGSRHETTTRKAFETLTHDTPRERAKVIIPVSRTLKDDISGFSGAYNINESTTGYLCLLASLSREPVLADNTRVWMRDRLEMWWEDLHLKTMCLELRGTIIDGWERGGRKPWEK